MKIIRLKYILQLAFLFGISILWSQQNPVSTSSKQISNYDYQETFAPFFYSKDGTNVRSASGQPGFEYWQNRADYMLTAKLDEANNEITGTSSITYTNNSPDAMTFLWLTLDQNLFREGSRGNAVVPITGSRNGAQGEIFDGGHKIKSVKIVTALKGGLIEKEAKYLINDTRMQVFLPQELKSRGEWLR